MPVTKQTYSLTGSPAFTLTQVADLFRQAFIDAGYMTDWHDSFSNGGIDNRVLRVQYDAAKAYGTCFYWFKFWDGSSRIRVTFCTGWNTTTKVPTGVQFLDFNDNTTNNDGNDISWLSSINKATSFDLIRWTSQINPTFSFFLVRNGSTFTGPFTIGRPSHGVLSCLDLDKFLYHAFIQPFCLRNGAYAASVVNFVSYGILRRSYLGNILNGDTIASRMGVITNITASYLGLGRASNDYTGNNGFGAHGISWTGPANSMSLVLPTAIATNNPAWGANYSPVFTGLPYSQYAPASNLPADFGIAFHYAANNANILDKYIVSAGVDEWDILARNNAAAAGTGATAVFLAKVVG